MRRKPLQKARMIENASDDEIQAVSQADKRLLVKIRKCLDRAYHVNASEAEAKTALLISQKLMSEHNITKADLSSNDANKFKAHNGGKRIVRIEKIAGLSRRVTREAFVERLAAAMCTFFDCKSYSTDFGIYIDWSFFGIASNTIAAAMAFEVVHNLILDWACRYKGGPSAFSYQIGVADGLRRMAKQEKENELRDARKVNFTETAGKKQGRTCRDSSNGANAIKLNGEKSQGKKTEIDGLNIKSDLRVEDGQPNYLSYDVDEMFRKYLKWEKAKSPDLSTASTSSASLDSDSKLEPEPHIPMASICLWESQRQLIRFRATSEQVAADYLAQQNIKPRCRRRRNTTIRDKLSYFQGYQDSSKINVREI